MSKQAEMIADAIMGASVIGRATRVALMQGRVDDVERDLGGLNRTALIGVIDKAIASYASDQPADEG